MSSSSTGDPSEACDDTVHERPTSDTTRWLGPPALSTSQTTSLSNASPIEWPPDTQDGGEAPTLGKGKESGHEQSHGVFDDVPLLPSSILLTSPNAERAVSDIEDVDLLLEAFNPTEPSLKSPSPAIQPSAIPEREASQAWQDLRVMRARVIKKRVGKTQKVEALRRHRRSLREQESSIIEEFLEHLDGNLISSAVQFRQRIAALKQLRHEYESLEDECAKTEDDIIAEEWRMGKLEDRFYTEVTGDSTSQNAIEHGFRYRYEESEDDNDTASTVSVSLIRADPSSTAQLYLSKLGDRDILRERLGGLRSERAYLEAERATRALHGLSLDQDSLQTLAEFDLRHEELMTELAEVEANLEELRGQLSHRELQPLSPRSTSSSQPVQEESVNDSAYDQPLSASEQEMFWPLTRHSARPFFDNSRETSDMSKFINDWLLYNLRILDREKQIYLQLTRQYLPRSEHNTLGQQIIDHWSSDDMADSFTSAKQLGSWSLRNSVKATLDGTRRNTAQSEAPVTRRRRNLPLLQINANTRASSIIARAREEQASSGVTVL